MCRIIMKYLVSFLFFSIICQLRAEDGYLPAFITPCDFRKNDIISCIKTEMNNCLKEFSKGIPELNVPVMDPIHVGDIINKHPSLEFTFRNTEVHGVSDVHVKELHTEKHIPPTTFGFTFFGNLSLTTHYTAKGQILILSLDGEGSGNVNVSNILVDINNVLEEYADSNNKYHFRLTNVTYKYKMERVTFEFENLVKGNKQLSDTILQVVNENWEELWEEFAPQGVNQIVTAAVSGINKFFAAVPNDRLFLNYKHGQPWGSGE